MQNSHLYRSLFRPNRQDTQAPCCIFATALCSYHRRTATDFRARKLWKESISFKIWLLVKENDENSI